MLGWEHGSGGDLKRAYLGGYGEGAEFYKAGGGGWHFGLLEWMFESL